MSILLIGYYGFANAGDEAILRSIVTQLRAQRPAIPIVVCSGNPKETAASHGVDAVAWNDVAAIARATERARLVVIGGGGLFQDYWGVDPNTLLTDAHWGISYYAGCAFLARLFGKPLMLYAVGIGPLMGEHGKELTRAACEAAHVITVRDQGSQRLLTQILSPGHPVRVTADPAWAWRPSARNSTQDAATSRANRTPVLAVAVRRWSFGVHPDFLETELAAAIDRFLEETGGTAVFFPFQDLRGEFEDDRATAERIQRKMRCADRTRNFPSGAAIAEFASAFVDCDVALAMRLHSVIWAAANGIPFVALSYDPKIGSIAELLDGEEPIDARSLDANVLVRRLLTALRSGGDSAKRIQTKVESLELRCAEDCRIALELFDHPPASSAETDPSPILRRAVPALLQRVDSLKLVGAALQQSIEKLETRNRELDGAQRASVSERARLQATAADLEQKIEAFDRENQTIRATVYDLQRQLETSAQSHAGTLAAIDSYRARFERELRGYRTQRAWKLMLLMRKAYTLLFRDRDQARFLRWTLGLPFGHAGSLAPYELPFPDIAAHIPDTARLVAAPAVAPVTRSVTPSFRLPEGVRAPGNCYDIVILAIIDFDFRFQRPQQIAAEWARRGHRVFWISPSRFLPQDANEYYKLTRLRDGICEVHLRSSQPDIYMGELTDAHLDAMHDSLSHVFADCLVAEHIVVVQLPFWRRLALSVKEKFGSRLMYDCMDDWETFQNLGAFNLSEERSLIRECDLLVVTGKELLEKYQMQGLSPVLVRNGADYDFFAKARRNDLLMNVPKPIVGYFGAIADWMDLDLTYEVARSRPQYSFVLIGQVFGRDTSAFAALPNVYLLGSKRYEDIPYYLYHFDACLIPFLLNQVTKSTDPVKLYEYFSLGKPVIATDMAELAQCHELLYIGRSSGEFAGHIDQALSETDPDLRQERIRFARENTWAARVNTIGSAALSSFPLVSILIVTYNSAPFVGPCFDAVLSKTAYPNFEIVTVDNASTDGTATSLDGYAQRHPNIGVIRSESNLGFAGGNNRAAQEARGEYLIFLNVDAIPTPGWIYLLLEHIRRDPSLGLICPVTNFAGNEAKVNIDYRNAGEMENFAARLSKQNRGRTLDISVAPLFCALMPRAVWETVGGELDAGYGIGMFEDDDLSIRVRQAGFRVAAAEDCFVHHFGQGSFAKLPSEEYIRTFETNRRRFEQKWKQSWVPHQTRPGTRPPLEEARFEPSTFV